MSDHLAEAVLVESLMQKSGRQKKPDAAVESSAVDAAVSSMALVAPPANRSLVVGWVAPWEPAPGLTGEPEMESDRELLGRTAHAVSGQRGTDCAPQFLDRSSVMTESGFAMLLDLAALLQLVVRQPLLNWKTLQASPMSTSRFAFQRWQHRQQTLSPPAASSVWKS